MENQRLILFVALSVVIMLLYNAWQEQYAPTRPAQTATVPVENPLADAQTPTQGTQIQDVPGQPLAPTTSSTGVPDIASASPAQAIAAKSSPQPGVLASAQRISVITDMFAIEIDTVGGDIRRAALLKYPVTAKNQEEKVQLFDDRPPYIQIAQSGLLSSNGPQADHHAVYQSTQSSYELSEGQDSISVELTLQQDGLDVIKRYTFYRGKYTIDMSYQVTNNTQQVWSGRQYRQLQRTNVEDKNKSQFIYTYTGGILSTPENPYEKINFDDMLDWKPEQSYSAGGWIAMIQHYFVGAWIPNQDEHNHPYTSVLRLNNVEEDNRYILGLQSVESQIQPGQSAQFENRLYIGPKEQKRLEIVAPHLELTVDYGILTVLAKPVYWLLDKIHGLLGNWGWAIIFVTLIVKLLFYKLSEASYKSMARMRKFAPKMQAIKERYSNDKQRMSQAMMDIYKKEKINPLGGCLPMLVQIPVFISLYWVLLESVELRQADFMLWITDLSSKDPYYVLPVIMGVSMYIQQKLNPAPMDPVQQKVLSFLPFIFTAFFAFFPSGLVLYWVVNNILSIGQQWYITRKIENS